MTTCHFQILGASLWIRNKQKWPIVGSAGSFLDAFNPDDLTFVSFCHADSKNTLFYKQWVYKHTEPQITDFLSILLSIFPASDLPMGKVLSQDFVYFVSEIEPGYDFFLSFVSSLLQMLEELIKIGN